MRSSIACGTIRAIHLDFDATGFAVVTARDIPGRNLVALIVDDQPCLADGVVNHPEEPILLLAHADREALLSATVRVEYDAGTPTFGPRQSTHVFKRVRIEKGSLDEGFAAAALVVETTDGWAGMTLKGTGTREVFSQLSQLQLAAEGFVQGDVGRLRAKVFAMGDERITILVPSPQADYLRDRILALGVTAAAPDAGGTQ